MNKAPDTRNKLDNNKGIKKPKKIDIKTMGKDLKQISIEDLRATPKKESKRSIFKREYGFSKTMRRNLKAAGLVNESGVIIFDDFLNQYKFIRKKRKAQETKARQKKHLDSVLFKRANGKKSKSKVIKKEKKKKDKE